MGLRGPVHSAHSWVHLSSVRWSALLRQLENTGGTLLRTHQSWCEAVNFPSDSNGFLFVVVAVFSSRRRRGGLHPVWEGLHESVEFVAAHAAAHATVPVPLPPVPQGLQQPHGLHRPHGQAPRHRLQVRSVQQDVHTHVNPQEPQVCAHRRLPLQLRHLREGLQREGDVREAPDVALLSQAELGAGRQTDKISRF